MNKIKEKISKIFCLFVLFASLMIFAGFCNVILDETVCSTYYYWFSIIIFSIVLIILIFCLDKFEREKKKINFFTEYKKLIIISILGILYLIVPISNYFFREGKPYKVYAKIIKQYRSGRGGTSRQNKIQFNNGKVSTINDSEIYNNFKKGDSICITLQKGLWGTPVIVDYETGIKKKVKKNKKAANKKEAKFPGGRKALNKYLQENIDNSKIKYKQGSSKDVYVTFGVLKDGTVCDVKIAKSSKNPSRDEEAIRVVSQMPKWEPCTIDGEKVGVNITLRVLFD